jgi:hypothetical protein
MKRGKLTLVSLLISILIANIQLVKSQDQLKVMQYNLLNYGNITSYCTATNNLMSDKESYLRTIVQYVQPDIFTVNEIAGNTYVVDRVIDSVLNYNSLKSYLRAVYVNTNGSDLVNMLYYNQDKLVYVNAQSLQNSTRDIVLYRLYYKSPNLAQSHDTAWVNCIVGHLKAGSTTADKTERALMTSNAMNYLIQHGLKGNYLFMGDFNIQSSSEQSYQNLINPTNTAYQFYDPLNLAGNWNNSGTYEAIHTQSTHASSNGCASSGGMDDRFDFIMISKDIQQENAHVGYVSNSYKVIGNDGNHLNQSINSGINASAPANVIEALYNMSDHLPVVIQLHFDSQVSGLANSDTPAMKVNFQNPVDKTLRLAVETLTNDDLNVEIWSVTGQLIEQYFSYNQTHFHFQIATSNLSSGMYILRIQSQNGQLFSTKLIKR